MTDTRRTTTSPDHELRLATVTFQRASRTYPGTDSPAVDALDLEIGDGEFLVLVGPSGCGESTTLRMLEGLEPVDDGHIFIGDRDVTDIAPAVRATARAVHHSDQRVRRRIHRLPAMNLLPATTSGTDATYGSLRVTLTPEQLEALTSAAITVGVRPNDFEIRAGGGLDATVEFVEELGSEAFLYCSADGTDKEIVARTDGLGALRSGDKVSLVPRTAGLHLFDTKSGARLPT